MDPDSAILTCGKPHCGATTTDPARDGWMVGIPRAPAAFEAGALIIRCRRHITNYVMHQCRNRRTCVQ